MNIVIHYVGTERFILMFDDDHLAEAYRTLGRWAANPELPTFDWYQATLCFRKIRQMVGEECVGK